MALLEFHTFEKGCVNTTYQVKRTTQKELFAS